MALTSTINLIELTWTLVALAGIVINLRAFGAARQDVAATRDRRFPARHVLAQQNVRNAILRAAYMGGYLLIGVIALTQPAPNPARPISLTGWVFTGVLLASAVANLAIAEFEQRDRVRVRRLVRQQLAPLPRRARIYDVPPRDPQTGKGSE